MSKPTWKKIHENTERLLTELDGLYRLAEKKNKKLAVAHAHEANTVIGGIRALCLSYRRKS